MHWINPIENFSVVTLNDLRSYRSLEFLGTFEKLSKVIFFDLPDTEFLMKKIRRKHEKDNTDT